MKQGALANALDSLYQGSRAPDHVAVASKGCSPNDITRRVPAEVSFPCPEKVRKTKCDRQRAKKKPRHAVAGSPALVSGGSRLAGRGGTLDPSPDANCVANTRLLAVRIQQDNHDRTVRDTRLHDQALSRLANVAGL